MDQNIRFLNKSQTIIRNSDDLNRTIAGMQSSMRGYLLTQDSSFLEEYPKGLKTVPFLSHTLRDLVSQNGKQLRILDSIKKLHIYWVNYAEGLIESRSQPDISNQGYSALFEGQLKNKLGRG